MSEHKLKEAGNGDGDNKKISSHIVEVIDSPIFGECSEKLAGLIEAAYTRMAERAERENSLIVGVVQALSTYALSGERAYVLIALTAQRISREDFERQQRMAQFSGGPRR